MSIEAIITEAVNLAAQARDKNPDLRKLFGSAKVDKNYPLPVTGENVGKLLQKSIKNVKYSSSLSAAH